MKLGKVMRFCLATVLCAFIGCVFGVYAKDKGNVDTINSGLLRFHITANSDSEKDQSVKMQVREFIFQNVSFDRNMTKNEVEKWFLKNKGELEEKINGFLKDKKCGYKAVVSVKKEYFGIRKYNNFILPAGNYDAIVVKLGKGEGKNFFCVMYPSLCMIDDVDGDVKGNMKELQKNFTPEQIRLMEKNDGETVIKFKIIEILNKFL